MHLYSDIYEDSVGIPLAAQGMLPAQHMAAAHALKCHHPLAGQTHQGPPPCMRISAAEVSCKGLGQPAMFCVAGMDLLRSTSFLCKRFNSTGKVLSPSHNIQLCSMQHVMRFRP